MSDYNAECIVCGEKFSTVTRNGKYCSPLCRATGAKQVREEWERTTGYKVKQRQRMRDKRKEEQSALTRHKKIHRTTTNEISQDKAEDRKIQRFEDIRKKAKQGDLHALQELALANGNFLEYWRLYKEKILKSERKFGNVGLHLVGGIDIHEESFEYLVVEQLENKSRK